MSFLSVKRSRGDSRCNLRLRKNEKTFSFCDLGIFKDSAFATVKRDANFLTRCVKGVRFFSIYRYTQRYLILSKMVL